MNQIEVSETTSLMLRHGLLAGIGGVIRVIETKDVVSMTMTQRLILFACGGAVGSFTGVLMFFACRHLCLTEYATAGLVGLAGYCGDPLLRLAAAKLKRVVKSQGVEDKD